MGIFGKKQDLPSFDSLEMDDSQPSADRSQDSFGIGGGAVRTQHGGYTIEQAMKLVNSLQGHSVKPDVIAGIVKQTLESVNIHFKDIVADAQRKEIEIKQLSKQKEEQIKEINKQMQVLEQEKIKLQQELSQTESVRKFLQQAIKDEPAVAVQPAAVAKQPLYDKVDDDEAEPQQQLDKPASNQ